MEYTRPESPARKTGRILIPHIGPRIATVGDGPTCPNHFRSNVEVALVADRDHPAIAVYVLWIALNGRSANQVGKRYRRVSPATPSFTLCCFTWLPALGRINSEEPDPLAVDFESVAVDDAGYASDRFGLCLCRPQNSKREWNNTPNLCCVI
jgi:hypothetical protein